MITLITGTPGAGKSAALVDLLMRECERRALYVDGVPELTVPHVVLDKPREWMTTVEDGAAVVIDEVQRVWRPRGAAAGVPADVAALETHRHRGLDFYLVTQHPNLLDANVRRLVGRHVHLRDVGLLGRWWYEWPEASDPATFRNAPIKKRYKLPKRVFGAYKSASMHVKPVRSIPPSMVFFGVAVLAVLGLGARGYASVNAKIEAAKPAATQSSVKPASSPPAPPSQTAETASQTAAPAVMAAVEQPPRVVGCIATPKRCACIDEKGAGMVVEWEACQHAARSGFGGLVPLAMGQTQSGVSPPVAVAAVPAPVAVNLGGDPRAHIR